MTPSQAGSAAACDGGDVEDGMKRMSKAECRISLLCLHATRTSQFGWAFLAQQRARVNAVFHDEVGVGQNGFQFGQNVFKARPT